jgi:hypothetical protein
MTAPIQNTLQTVDSGTSTSSSELEQALADSNAFTAVATVTQEKIGENNTVAGAFAKIGS